MKEFIANVFWTLDEAQHPARDKTLAELGISESGAVTDNFMGHAARDTIQQKTVTGVFKDGAMPRRLEVVEIAVSLGIEGAFGAKTHITDLSGNFAELRPVWQGGRIVQVLWKMQRFIESVQKTC